MHVNFFSSALFIFFFLLEYFIIRCNSLINCFTYKIKLVFVPSFILSLVTMNIEHFPNLACWLLYLIWKDFEYSVAQIIWPSIIHMSRIICTVILDTTLHHWWPMLNWPFNSYPDFMQSYLIQTFTQILFSPNFQIYVKIFTPTPTMIPPWIFHWTKVHFVGPLIAPILDFVFCITLPMGFKARVVLTCTVTCLYAVNPRVKSGVIPTFSTNLGFPKLFWLICRIIQVLELFVFNHWNHSKP